jgi:hypothetical protein
MDDSFNARTGVDPDRTDASNPHQPAGNAPPGVKGASLGPPRNREDFEDSELADEPDRAACLNDWLRDNWDTIHALARAGQLPELRPPLTDPGEIPDDPDPLAFDPASLRARLDGWTAERQSAFIQCLAESACVVEACRSVKMSKQSAYALRARPEAISFRTAWDAALDFATRRLADAVLSRAVNGVAVPVFYQGEQVGERRTYDERLAMFLLQRRDPLRYGDWRNRQVWAGHAESHAVGLLQARVAVREDAGLTGDGLVARFSQRLRAILAGVKDEG